MVHCNRCNQVISEDESFTHLGQTLCEDCYIDIMDTRKGCDPWAVYIATRSRESSGSTNEELMSDLQKAIVNFISNKGKAMPEEVMNNLKISRRDLENQVATLRHMELIKGRKEGPNIYLVPFSYDG
jgi:hypothetical protein